MKKIMLFIGALLVSELQVLGQECGTIVTQENLDFLEQRGITSRRSLLGSDVVVKIPIKFHALKKTTGEGGMTEETKESLVDQLNSFYTNSNIIFEHVGNVNEIVDDEQYDFDGANEGAVAVGNDVQKTINIYFFNSIVSGGSQLCGYTYFPPSSDRVFMAYGCIQGGTFEHEVGHYFTLFHTHGTTNTGTTDELVDGSNCVVAGDRICDTPADPNLSGVVNGSCAYAGILKDVNGDGYSPDPSNFMSYAPGNCRERFSNGQYDRIRLGFESGRSYLNFTTEDFTALISSDQQVQCIGGEIRYNPISFGAISYEWTFEGGTPAVSEDQNPVVMYNTGGEFNVELKVTDNSGKEVVVTSSNFITIEDPLQSPLVATFVSGVDADLPSEFKVTNPDEGFTFEYSNVDEEASGVSGSIFMNNFDYFTENLRNTDRLRLENFNTDGIKKFNISFDYAYTYLFGSGIFDRYDSLVFQIRSQCGSQETILWKSGGDKLKTAPAIEELFIPSVNQWLRKNFEIAVDESFDFIGFEFVSHSYNGNNLYIDNVNVTPDFTVDVPIDFRLGKVEAGVATFRWFDGSNNETAYVLERAVNDGEFAELISLEPNTILYRDASLEIGNSYSYRLFADGVNGNTSVYTDVVEVSASQITTGIEDELKKSVFVYPNPASGIVGIMFENVKLQNFKFNVTDISGKVLVGERLISGLSETIDISHLKSGIYLINIFKESKSITKRLIKK